MKAWHLCAADARKCLELNPGFVKASVRLGTALLQLNEFDEARQAVKAGLQADLNCTELGDLLKEIRQRERGEHLQEEQLPHRSFDAIDKQKSEQRAAEAQHTDIHAKQGACDELYSKQEELAGFVIELGGFLVPFDEAQPVTFLSGEPAPKGHPAVVWSLVCSDVAQVFDFGNRLELFASLRVLFLCQSLFMSMRAILAKAYEVGLLKMEDSPTN